MSEQNQESGLNWPKTLSSEPGFSLVITWGVIRVTVSENPVILFVKSVLFTHPEITNKKKKHAQHLRSLGPQANDIDLPMRLLFTDEPMHLFNPLATRVGARPHNRQRSPPPPLLPLRFLPSLLTEWSQISSSNSRVSCTARLLEANVRFVKNGFDQLLLPILSTTAKRGLPCDTRYSRCRTDFDSRVRQNEWWREADECGRQVGGGWGCFDVGNMSLKPVSFVMCFKRFHAWAEFFTLYTPPATCASLWCKNKFP